MVQKYSSARTSINKNKIPIIFKKIIWSPDTCNLDYGGGKYDTASIYLKKYRVTNNIYDPYNRSLEHNNKVLIQNHYDTVTISNVMNVIQELEIRLEIIEHALTLLKDGGTIFITVYEGDKTGVGKKTLINSWQENRRLKTYLEDFQSYSPMLKNNMIIIKKEV